MKLMRGLVTGRARTVGTQVLEAITWHRRQAKAAPADGRRVTSDTQARWGRSGGGRVAGGSATGVDAGVGHGQVDGRVGAGYRHGQAYGRTGACNRHRSGTGARAGDGYGKGGRTDGQVRQGREDGRAGTTRTGGRADGHILQVSWTTGACCRRGERRVRVRAMGTARRAGGRATGTCCRHARGWTHATDMAKGAGGGHCGEGERTGGRGERCRAYGLAAAARDGKTGKQRRSTEVHTQHRTATLIHLT